MTVGSENVAHETRSLKTSNSTQFLDNAQDPQNQSRSLSESQPENGISEEAPSHQIATRSSTRSLKRTKKDFSPPNSPPKKPAKEPKTNTPDAKTRRPWEGWTLEDKDTFFEGLYEYGKDFDAIQNLITLKHKRKGDPVHLIKNKEQVRHFYYRTWHKISKYVHIGDEVKKATQELYGLVNYGELRKRIGGALSEKNGQKLTELIHKGTTCVKVKGKTFRLKTPVCKALKKLNNVEEETRDEEPPKVPERCVLELQPRSNAAYAHVQSQAQNPRIRMTVKLERRLGSIIEYLQKKWKPQRQLLKESFKVYDEPEPRLRIYPSLEAQHLAPVTLKPTPQNKLDLGFENYKQHILDKEAQETEKKKAGNKRQAGDVLSDDSNSATQATGSVDKEQPDKGHITNNNKNAPLSVDPKTSGASEKDKSVTMETSCLSNTQGNNLLVFNRAEDDAATSAALQCNNSSNNDNNTHKSTEKTSSENNEEQKKKTVNESNEEQRRSEVERFRNGWTLQEAENLSIAHIHLILGSPEKLVLEYEWEEPNETPHLENASLSNMLRRLVHLAMSEFTDFSKPKQPGSSSPCKCCGNVHTGGSPRNRSSQNRSPGGSTRSPSVRGGQMGKSPSTPKTSRRNTDGRSSPVSRRRTQSGGDKAADVSDKNKEDDSVFRKPADFPAPKSQSHQKNHVKGTEAQLIHTQNTQAEARNFMEQLSRLSRQDLFSQKNKMRSRMVRKPMVVQRTLLPKATVPTRHIMGLPVIHGSPSQLSTGAVPSGSFIPIIQQQQIANQNITTGGSGGSVLNPGSGSVLDGQSVIDGQSQQLMAQVQAVVSSQPLVSIFPSAVTTVQTIVGGQQGTQLVTSDSAQGQMTTDSSLGQGYRKIAPAPLVQGSASLSPLTVQALPGSSTLLHVRAESPMTVIQASSNSPGPISSSDLAPSPMLSGVSGIQAASSPVLANMLGITRTPTTTSVTTTVTSSGTMAPLNEFGLGDNVPARGNTSNFTSPPNMSSFLDISLPEAPPVAVSESADKLIDFALENVLERPSTPPMSSSTLGFQGLSSPEKWFNGEMGDISLGSLLESPLKKDVSLTSSVIPTTPLFNECSRDSIASRFDVDSTISALMNENSLDYMAKFAELAAQVSAQPETPKKGEPRQAST
ncbi:protein cramped-like isoform X2 [Lingula anatina]|nr:protein cramped-like isoform X2 [Lingula anatina]|eukprot:XP_013378859.1 protein cramped-like isoform X2 [Lingula anatina]